MRRVNDWLLLIPVLALAVARPLAAAEPVVILTDGRLEVRAERHSLRDVLAQFGRYGIEVNFDAGADAVVDGVIPSQPVDDALRVLLQSAGYVTRWNMVDAPGGPLPVLAGIDVFRRGGRATLAPIAEAHRGAFAVVRGPDGVEYAADEILLGLNPGADGERFRALLSLVSGQVVSMDKRLGVYRVKLPPGSDVPAAVERLRRHPLVAGVEPNYAYRLPESAAAPVNAAPGVPRVPANERAGLTPLAVLDSGLSPGLDLGPWVVARHDATQPGVPLNDASGHGTQMALIASGAVQPKGVEVTAESGVPVMAIKTFDANGVATSFSVMDSLSYARGQGARVVSLSWGSTTDSGFLRAAVAEATNNGLVLVAAAGNVPDGKPVYPAAYPGVVAIGALQADGTRWDKSNYGNFLTATAAGTADFPVGHDGPPGSYAGTSISTPWVARAFTQYFAAYPNASTTQAIAAFQSSVTDAGDPGQDPYYGWGVFDRAAANRFLATKPSP